SVAPRRCRAACGWARARSAAPSSPTCRPGPPVRSACWSPSRVRPPSPAGSPSGAARAERLPAARIRAWVRPHRLQCGPEDYGPSGGASMDIEGKVAIVTGAASGIGRATALKFAAEGAAGVVLADLNEAKLREVAADIDGLPVPCDVGRQDDIQRLVQAARDRYGRVDVYFSNAGIIGEGGPEAPDELWDAMWRIHLMAHVWAARAVVEPMLASGGGQFIITASAACLLNIIEPAPYGVTKHAAGAFAEGLSIAYRRRGLAGGRLCPQGSHTRMVPRDGGSAGVDGIVSAEAVAEDVLAAMRDRRFLVLPHPQVLDYMRAKTNDYDRWLGGMQKLFMKANPQ